MHLPVTSVLMRLSCHMKVWKALRILLAGSAFLAAIILVLNTGLPDRARAVASGYLPGGVPIAPEAGAAAPALAVNTVEGAPYTFTPGTPLVLNFWATWCGPCAAEFEMLNATYAQTPGVAFLAVNMGEGADAVRAWLDVHPARFTIVRDRDAQTFDRYRVRGTPSTFFIDSKGIIRQIVYGPLSAAGLQSAVAALQ